MPAVVDKRKKAAEENAGAADTPPPALPNGKARRVAFAFPRGAHQELLIEGVCKYASQHRCNWTYTVAPESLTLSILDLTQWNGDGVLAAINTPEEARAAAKFKVPIVNISSALAESPVPRSMVDNHIIGMRAADHLVSRGFKNMAYYGLLGVEYAAQRLAGFRERLKENGLDCDVFFSTPTFRFNASKWMEQNQQLATWLQGLPKPCGVFAVTDYRARYVLDACQQNEIEAPEQVSVVGVDNEPFICEHVAPTLTSVERNNTLEGFTAAHMLHQLMSGAKLDAEEVRVPPLEVVKRDSTAAFAVSDPRLREALAYLHDYLADPITVEEMAENAGVSRRWLEYAFRDALGETPYQYIRRQRLLRAKRFLGEEPGAKISEVARRTGFASVKQMRIAFQQEVGVTPGVFRDELLERVNKR